MWKSIILFLTLALLQQYVLHVEGHARLREPPSRSSMWRDGFTNPTNPTDNGLNCGGSYNQHSGQGGKCGMCGDPYQNAQPRDNERGGKYGQGSRTRTYTEGQVIDIKVEVTANHKGWFEIRVCKTDNPSIIASEQCLNQHLLPISGSANTQYTVPTGNVWVEYQVRLPMGLTCTWCVLQWKYHAGNNWATDPVTGQKCLGCGPQEEFYGCADVEIVATGGGGGNPTPPPPTPPPPPPPTPSPPSWQTPPTPPPTWQTPPTPPPTWPSPPTPPPTWWQPSPATPPPATPPPSSGTGICRAVPNWAHVSGMDTWCLVNCNWHNPYCPPSHCICS